MIVKDCTERLSAVDLSVGLIIPRGLCVSRHVVRASSPPKCLDWDYARRRGTGTRHGNVNRSVREKQEIVVYQQRVLQTVSSLRVVSLVFRGHDLLKIAESGGNSLSIRRFWGKGATAEMEPTIRDKSSWHCHCHTEVPLSLIVWMQNRATAHKLSRAWHWF